MSDSYDDYEAKINLQNEKKQDTPFAQMYGQQKTGVK